MECARDRISSDKKIGSQEANFPIGTGERAIGVLYAFEEFQHPFDANIDVHNLWGVIDGESGGFDEIHYIVNHKSVEDLLPAIEREYGVRAEEVKLDFSDFSFESYPWEMHYGPFLNQKSRAFRFPANETRWQNRGQSTFSIALVLRQRGYSLNLAKQPA